MKLVGSMEAYLKGSFNVQIPYEPLKLMFIKFRDKSIEFGIKCIVSTIAIKSYRQNQKDARSYSCATLTCSSKQMHYFE